jgi:hypothetical protein
MSALAVLTDRNRMSRMINADLRQDDPFTVNELFSDINRAVFGQLTGLDRFQRNLQLAYVDHLSGIMNNLRPFPFVPNAPDEARAIARLELTELGERLASTTASNRMDRAHLLELASRVEAAFNIDRVREAE